MYGHKVLTKLDRKKHRDELGLFLVEGKKSVSDAITAKADIEQLVVTDRFVHEQRQFCQNPQVQSFFQSRRVLTLSESSFAELSETTTPQGVIAVIKKPANVLTPLLNGETIIILDDLRDPGNVGTIIRTADWFGVDGVIFVGGADPFQSKVVRASMGSFFHLPIYDSVNVVSELEQLKQSGFTIITTRPELADQPSSPLPRQQKLAIIFGNESRGTSAVLDEAADQSFSLPRFGNAESLNVAVSVGLVLYELKR